MSPTYKVSKINVALHKMFKLKLTKLNLKKQQPIKKSFQQQQQKRKQTIQNSPKQLAKQTYIFLKLCNGCGTLQLLD